jgi:hypothetical protein
MEQLEREILAEMGIDDPYAKAEGRLLPSDSPARPAPALDSATVAPRIRRLLPHPHGRRRQSPASRRQEPRRTWLDRITAALSGEPTTREDLVELLRDVQADGLIAADTLRMMEGAIAVSDLTVGDVMIPRAQMVALSADARSIR